MLFVKNLFKSIDDIINHLNEFNINIKNIEQNQNSIDVKYELDSLKEELSQIIDEKTSLVDENQNYNVNQVLAAINNIKDNLLNLDNQINDESKNEKDANFREEIKSNLTKLSELIESSSLSTLFL